jgi:hypothetical protein
MQFFRWSEIYNNNEKGEEKMRICLMISLKLVAHKALIIAMFRMKVDPLPVWANS